MRSAACSGLSARSPRRSGVASLTARTRVGEPVWPKRGSSSSTSPTRSAAVHVCDAALGLGRLDVPLRRPDAFVDPLGDGDDRGEVELVGVVALVGLAAAAQAVPGRLQPVDVRELGPAEERRHLGRHLPRLRVDRLAAAEDEVGALLLDGERQRPRRADRVGDGEDLVVQVDRAVGAHGEGHPQRVLRLRRPHRHGHDLATVLVAEPDRLGDRVDVELVQLERHSLAHEPLRLRVEPDVLRAWNLLDEDDDLHAGSLSTALVHSGHGQVPGTGTRDTAAEDGATRPGARSSGGP